MNNLDQNINDLILWVKTAATTTQGFITEQTPLYIKEFLSWYFWEAIFYASVTSILLCITLSVALWTSKKYSKLRVKELENSERYGGDSENYQIVMVVSLVVSAMLLLPICVNAHNALKVKIAPRVIIVQELTHKLKK